MGYDDGWAALNLDMPGRIPRTEYSVLQHWDLISAVTQREVSTRSPWQEREQAQRDFLRAWDFGLRWSVMVSHDAIKGRQTDMGHAVYMADGSDRRDSAPCPFATPEEVLAYDPLTEAGEYAPAKLAERFNEHYRQSVDFYPDTVNMSGTYITMFSGFIALFGWEMLLTALGTDPVAFGALAGRYEAWIRQFFEAFANSDVPVMMVHDDIVWTSGPVVAPAWYREYIFPAYKRLIRPVLDAGKKVLFTSDGTYTEFFDDIVQAGFHGLVFEPTSDMALFAERYGKTHAFVGNADTRTLLTGTRDEIRAEVRRCVDIGRDCPGFFMAVGNHIPANTPVDNALFYNEVFQELRERS